MVVDAGHKRTDELLSSPTALPSPADPVTLSKTLLLLLQLFYDLNSQDLPEYFEDNLEPFMNLLHKYLTWSRPELVQNDEEEEAGPLEKIRASICEITQLFTQRYLDAFTMMEKFVETTWILVTGLNANVKYDIVSGSERTVQSHTELVDAQLASKAISFLSVSVRMPGKKAMFEGEGVLEAFCDKIILPNMALRRELGQRTTDQLIETRQQHSKKRCLKMIQRNMFDGIYWRLLAVRVLCPEEAMLLK